MRRFFNSFFLIFLNTFYEGFKRFPPVILCFFIRTDDFTCKKKRLFHILLYSHRSGLRKFRGAQECRCVSANFAKGPGIDSVCAPTAAVYANSGGLNRRHMCTRAFTWVGPETNSTENYTPTPAAYWNSGVPQEYVATSEFSQRAL